MNLPLDKILQGHVLEQLKQLLDESIDCCVTSPPYWGLRDYGTEPVWWPEVKYMFFGVEITVPSMICSLGLEKTPEQFIGHMVLIFRQVKRVLKPAGTCWVNMGDSYTSGARDRTPEQCIANSNITGKDSIVAGAKQINKIKDGNKPKDLVGIPWMLAFALRADGWYLRQDIIWHKPNPMPESVTDRCTKAHEYIFLLTKSPKYYYDAEAIKEDASTNSHARYARVKEEHKSIPDAKKNGLRPRKLAVADTGIKTNTSFYEAMKDMVDKRNKRSVWTINPQAFPEAHFATFPVELPELCIKAGSSQHGCCANCGKPWERILEKSKGENKTFNGSSFTNGKTLLAAEQNSKVGTGQRTCKTETLGWQPSCKCKDAGIVPAVVLDPFSGAATTFLVAQKLNRSAIGIELKPEYIKISDKRLRKELGMFYKPTTL